MCRQTGYIVTPGTQEGGAAGGGIRHKDPVGSEQRGGGHTNSHTEGGVACFLFGFDICTSGPHCSRKTFCTHFKQLESNMGDDGGGVQGTKTTTFFYRYPGPG